MTVQYGPWIAFNPGDTPPALDVVVQIQVDTETRIDAEKGVTFFASDFPWVNIIAYRVVKQPVRGEVVVTGWLDETGGVFSDVKTGKETNRITLPTYDGVMIPGTYTGPDGSTIKIEAL